MSDLNDFKLGGYHNAGGYIRDGTGGERVRPMSDEQAFVDALELPPPDCPSGWRDRSLRAFAAQAITAWQARPLPDADEIMRLADEYGDCAYQYHDKLPAAHAALEAAVRQQAAEIRTLRNVGVTQADRIVELERKGGLLCNELGMRMMEDADRIAAVSEPEEYENMAANARRLLEHEAEIVSMCRLGETLWAKTKSPLTDKDAISPLADVEAMCTELQIVAANADDQGFAITAGRVRRAMKMLRSLSKDAERYRELRKELSRTDPMFSVVAKAHFKRWSSEWCNFATAANMDAAIDAALAAKE